MITREEHDYILNISQTTILTFSEAKWLFNEVNGDKDIVQKCIQLCSAGIDYSPLINLYKQNMSFKKTPTIEELKAEVDALQEQAINGNARFNALKKQYDNHPAQKELDVLKGKWWYKFFKFIGL